MFHFEIHPYDLGCNILSQGRSTPRPGECIHPPSFVHTCWLQFPFAGRIGALFESSRTYKQFTLAMNPTVSGGGEARPIYLTCRLSSITDRPSLHPEKLEKICHIIGERMLRNQIFYDHNKSVLSYELLKILWRFKFDAT